MTLSELNLVRVVFIESDRAFTGSEGVARAPRIGDVGAVVHARTRPSLMLGTKPLDATVVG